MKTFSKDELKAKAAEVFKAYKKAQKVSLTSDGMAFIVDNGDNAVINHSKHNRYKKELKITTFTRDDIEDGAKKEEKTAKVLIAEIKAATEVAVVETILAFEKEREEPRSTVVTAAEARLKELKGGE